jgi:hypothetical protein
MIALSTENCGPVRTALMGLLERSREVSMSDIPERFHGHQRSAFLGVFPGANESFPRSFSNFEACSVWEPCLDSISRKIERVELRYEAERLPQGLKTILCRD